MPEHNRKVFPIINYKLDSFRCCLNAIIDIATNVLSGEIEISPISMAIESFKFPEVHQFIPFLIVALL